MFGRRYFGGRYFGPRYFGDGDGGGAAPSAPTDLRAGLNAYLRSLPAVAAIVGTRIRPGVLGLADALPALTYTVVANPRLHGLTGAVGQANARVQLDCWGGDPADCVALKLAIEDALDGYAGDLGGVACRRAEQLAERDLHEPPADASDRWLYRISVDYRFKHDCPVPSR